MSEEHTDIDVLKAQLAKQAEEIQSLKLKVVPPEPANEELEKRLRPVVEPPKPDPRLDDLDDIKSITLSNMLNGLSAKDKKILQPRLEGKSLKEAQQIINWYNEDKVVEPVGVPPVGSTGGMQAPGYFSKDYKHDFKEIFRKDVT